MKKVFKVADIREFERKVTLGEISYSRMVEEMNERSYLAYSKGKKLPNNCVDFLLYLQREAFEAGYESGYDEAQGDGALYETFDDYLKSLENE